MPERIGESDSTADQGTTTGPRAAASPESTTGPESATGGIKTVTIRTSDGTALEVPKNWKPLLDKWTESGQIERIHVFELESPPGQRINMDVFRGVFCVTVKVDPPPFTREIQHAQSSQSPRSLQGETKMQILQVLTVGDPCSARARTELEALLMGSKTRIKETVLSYTRRERSAESAHSQQIS